MVELISDPLKTNTAEMDQSEVSTRKMRWLQRLLEQFEENKVSLNYCKIEGLKVDRLLPHDLGREEFNKKAISKTKQTSACGVPLRL